MMMNDAPVIGEGAAGGPAAAGPPKKLENFAVEATLGEFKFALRTHCVEQQAVEWPIKAMHPNSGGIRNMFWVEEWQPAGIEDPVKFCNEVLIPQYRAACESYQRKDYDAYAVALRAMPVPLRLDPTVKLGQAFVQFSIRAGGGPGCFSLVVFLSNLPSIGVGAARKLAPDSNCLIRLPALADGSPVFDVRYTARAAQLLFEYGGGDLFLMRAVVQSGGGRVRAGISQENADEHEADLLDALTWVEKNAKWDDDSPQVWAAWYTTQRMTVGSKVKFCLDNGITPLDLKKSVEQNRSSQGRGAQLMVSCPCRSALPNPGSAEVCG